MSAAVPWMGVLMAVRSAAFRSAGFRAVSSGIARTRLIDDWIEDKLHMNPPGEWNLIWEGYAGMVERPETNFEIGSALGLRVSHKLAGDLRMFIEGASGPFYTTQKLKEQATQFNFASYVDVGLEYRLGERHALTVSQNLRHFSNADLDQPNDGVDTHGVEVGYIWYF